MWALPPLFARLVSVSIGDAVAVAVVAVMVVVDVGINFFGRDQSSRCRCNDGRNLVVDSTMVDIVAAATTIAVTGGGCS